LNAHQHGGENTRIYHIGFTNTTKAGNLQLKAGEYRVKVDGDKAVFTEVNTSKQFTVQVTAENSAKKFDQTRIDATNDGRVDTLKDIQLGGSTAQLDFLIPYRSSDSVCEPERCGFLDPA